MVSYRRRHGASVRTVPVPGQWKLTWGRRLRWMGAVLALAGIGAGLSAVGQKMLDPDLFPLRHVNMEGTLRNLNQADLQRLVAGYLGQNFFSLDMDALQRTMAADPWIERVDVRRSWPDRLVVRFQERTAFGYWGKDEMVDVNGARFRPAVVRQAASWPRLAGPDGHELQLIRVYREASARMGKVGLRIASLVQDERRAWRLTLDNGVEVSLGREHFTERLQRFVDIYPPVLSGRIDRVAAVDLRYINGFAVRWANSAGSPATGPKGLGGRGFPAGEEAARRTARIHGKGGEPAAVHGSVPVRTEPAPVDLAG